MTSGVYMTYLECRGARLLAPRAIDDPVHGALGTIQRISVFTVERPQWLAVDVTGVTVGTYGGKKAAINALCANANIPYWFPQVLTLRS